MHEPSDGIAEELERQLQLTLATAAIAARRAIAARQHAIQQAQRESEQAARAAQARIDAERLLATERLGPVFDPAWWETASPQQIADMWQEANSWHDPDQPAAATPTIFDHAAYRIRQEVRERSGLDPTQVITLAAVQDLEHEHAATVAQAAEEQDRSAAATQQLPRGFDDPQRREQLRARLAAALVPRARGRGTHARRPRPGPRGRRSRPHPCHRPRRAAARRPRPLRQRAHAGPRLQYKFEQLLPGGEDPDASDPILDAIELRNRGYPDRARALLEGLIEWDTRCIDADAHLGGLAFDHDDLEKAQANYATGVRIAEASLPDGFGGMLAWGWIDSRPFLRCLHGLTLSTWRLEQPNEAEELCRALLWLNPADNQGARELLPEIAAGTPWLYSR